MIGNDLTISEGPSASPAFLSEDGELIWLDGTWFRLTPEVPLSPDRQWVLANGNWRRVEQMPRTPQASGPVPETVRGQPSIGVPASRGPGQPLRNQPAMQRFSAPLRYHRRTVGIAAAAIAGVTAIAVLASSVLDNGSGKSAPRPQAQASAPVVAEPTEAPPATPSVSGTVTVMAPYGAVTNGKCAVSTVSRYYPPSGPSIDYQEPAPSRFLDVTAGSSFTVKDAAGAIVATGQLDTGTLTHQYVEVAPGYRQLGDPDLPKDAVSSNNHGFCQYTFSAADLPASNFYQLQFGAEPAITVSKADLQANGGKYAATFGDAYDAKRETDVFYDNLCISAVGSGGTCDPPAGAPNTAGSTTTGA